ncbi:MAG: thrombospondin type 3 repeat-containing protein [Patescibacteria group bacterium]|nr:thrombospondin type 3 repeat-containing protein [Patescibacteria group bacterium]
MKDIHKILISIILLSFSAFILFTNNKSLANFELSTNLKGKILLQIENHGEAYYVSPYDLKKHFLGRPDDAFDLMKNLSLGISNKDLEKIPVAEANFLGKDADKDGLSDAIEQSLGTNPNMPDSDNDGYSDKEEILSGFNPLNTGKRECNQILIDKLAGYILLQVEANGEAWYLNPSDKKRYYLSKPTHAFNLMKSLGLGITNENLVKIEDYDSNPEFKIENLIAKYTTPLSNSSGLRKYEDPAYNFSLNYPNSWTLKKGEYDNITQFSDANLDFILEKKGVITITVLKTQEERNINVFRMAAKGKSVAQIDEEKIINSRVAYENSYKHLIANERTTTIKINKTTYLQITLATAKNNDSHYNDIYDNLIESITFEE